MNPRSVPDLCPKRRLRGRFLPARLAKKGGAVELPIPGDDFPVRVAETLALRFVPQVAALADDEEMEFAADDPDEIEFDGESFDLGEAVAQSLALAIDPYAEGPNADVARREAGIVDEDAPKGALADALRALRPD